MAPSAPLLHYSWGLKIRTGHLGTSSFSSSHSSASSSPSPSASCSWKLFKFSAINNFRKRQCLRAQAMSTNQGNFASPSGVTDVKDEPDHLLVLVHGIMGSPNDWIYVEAELRRCLGRSFLIHASSCNMYAKTFAGIDGAGKRLADEVVQVVKGTGSLRKISFLAHSLGGLLSRYAIAVLYTPDVFESDLSNDVSTAAESISKTVCSSGRGMVAGLEPVNFITLGTPHLGVRGKKQLPFLLGVPILEFLAMSTASFFAGRTGSQLFLTDGKLNKPPLLLRMASDCEDGKFLSALGVFRRRILYANVSYDHMVGWRTSSIRREAELFKPSHQFLDGYKHVVDVKHCPAVSSEGPCFPPEAAKAKEAAQNEPNSENSTEYHEIMEEEMIRGLQQLSWRKVDVNFHSAIWPFSAHNNLNVKNEWLNNAGVGVVAHVADNLQQEEMQIDSTHV